MVILGIESSCDETAAAVVENGTTILSSVVASQMTMHAKYGGVVPDAEWTGRVGAGAGVYGSCGVAGARGGGGVSAGVSASEGG